MGKSTAISASGYRMIQVAFEIPGMPGAAHFGMLFNFQDR